MTCPHCGENVVPDATFCHRCGTRISTPEHLQQAQPVPPQSVPPVMRLGRGGTILTLGILSIVMFGPLTGIPAWVMGQRDLKDIRAGNIPQHEHGMTMAGMVLGIIGTAIGALVVIGIIIAISIAMIGVRHDFSGMARLAVFLGC